MGLYSEYLNILKASKNKSLFKYFRKCITYSSDNYPLDDIKCFNVILFSFCNNHLPYLKIITAYKLVIKDYNIRLRI